MSITSLILMVIFVIIPIVISKSLKLGLEKDTVIAGIRSFIQLLIVGYILQFIFDKDNPIFMILDYLYRSEEHTSELQSRFDLVCRLLLEKKERATGN